MLQKLRYQLFKKLGVTDIKNGDFRYPPMEIGVGQYTFLGYLGTKCNILAKEIVCRNFVQGHVQ